jgi:CBS domain-containing membrane protein
MAAMGGPAIAEAGLMFPLMPVAVDSLLLVTIGLLFHRLIGQSYPHRAQPVMASHKTEDAPAQLRANLLAQDIDAVLAEAGETHDISREDLNRILRRAEQRALARSHRIPSCADLMARDVIRVSAGQPPDLARHLLLHHAVRTLPVVDIDNRVIGTVGLRELTLPASRVDEVMSAAVTARPDQPVLSLLDPLTTGRSHAVMITDDEGRLLGLVSQTDLLVALSRLKARQAGAAGEPALSS